MNEDRGRKWRQERNGENNARSWMENCLLAGVERELSIEEGKQGR